MSLNKTNSSLWPCLHLIHLLPYISWDVECILCRVGGTIILLISIICFILNIRYFIWYRRERSRNIAVLSLFLGSFLVLTLSVPHVLLQLFTCHRHCNEIYCRIEGFISYLSGCLCMLIYMILSINRYLLLSQCDNPLFTRNLTILCWIFSIFWTFPPVFNYWISYVPEGLGFHCSINWNDHSQQSHIYILFSFICIYLLPLITIFVVNFRVHQLIRNIYLIQSSLYFHRQSNNIINYIRKAADRKRLRIEYRFVKAIICLLSAYIFSWTPYSIIALLQLFHAEFIFQYPFFITLSAFVAKLSVILAPFVYLSIMQFQIFKKILFH